MEIRSIQPALPMVGASGALPTPAPAAGFGQALTEAIKRLDQLQREADEQGLMLAAGYPVEIHDVMLAQNRAALGLDLAIQVRNKLVESYQEIMRMQV